MILINDIILLYINWIKIHKQADEKESVDNYYLFTICPFTFFFPELNRNKGSRTKEGHRINGNGTFRGVYSSDHSWRTLL